ncbi:uncharacterized protein B0I36DRAFT_92455 [Microdochium trichocladiopsis]|uniref:Uncharacterized protein n=1 Tax=Microdochium trichocladiopsis TaxID=1682393 RepID=A0A9P8YCI2_9PEZI|nr:uncharacterized protein B0I36DRAFT_92455 [Microdochium trichocladiopsis]KAH7035425.1 hypothetical protein B0I36DRAFT_92455 [Microdochium trichocladiopsis]
MLTLLLWGRADRTTSEMLLLLLLLLYLSTVAFPGRFFILSLTTTPGAKGGTQVRAPHLEMTRRRVYLRLLIFVGLEPGVLSSTIGAEHPVRTSNYKFAMLLSPPPPHSPLPLTCGAMSPSAPELTGLARQISSFAGPSGTSPTHAVLRDIAGGHVRLQFCTFKLKAAPCTGVYMWKWGKKEKCISRQVFLLPWLRKVPICPNEQ